MNPFALQGPAFLGFYAGIGVFALLLQYFWSRANEVASVPPQLKMTDPYMVAYLRGGSGDALRVAALSLIERKLLTASGRMLAAEPGAEEKVESPIETAVLHLYRAPQKVDALDASAIAAPAFEAYQSALLNHGLLSGPKTFAARLIPACVGASIIVGVGLLKLGIALSEGRHNVGYLILMLIVFFIISVALFRKRGTRAGSAMLGDLQTMFRPSWARAEELPKDGAGNEVAMLAAVFGITSLPEVRFPGLFALQPEPDSNTSSSRDNSGWSRRSSSGGSGGRSGSKFGCGG